MGSVISYDDECPKCKKEMGFNDFYYKNHEEYFYCQNEKCQFSYSYSWKRDEEHALVTQDGTDNYNFTNLIMVERVVENGKETIKEIYERENDMENNEMMSLYDYLGHAAGGDLGQKVAYAAAKDNVKHGERNIDNPRYKGIVYTYPKVFLDEYFNK
jgi:hypothetical protein